MEETRSKSSLFGATAIVTGAGQGIGRACAVALAQNGARVMLVGRRPQPLEQTASLIAELGAEAKVRRCDVSSYDEVEEAVSACVSWGGRLDILINNAGVIEPLSHMLESDPVQWSQAIDVNVKGVYHGMRAAGRVMRAAGGGTIVNMSSGAANSALVGWSHYCASKAAAQRLTQVGHKELGTHGVWVLGLSPGTVATPMMEKIRAAKINAVSELDRSLLIDPAWVGRAVVFLCGPKGRAFAGQDFSIKTPEGRALVGLS